MGQKISKKLQMSEDENVTNKKPIRRPAGYETMSNTRPSDTGIQRLMENDTKYTKDLTDKNKTKELQMSEDESVTNAKPVERPATMAFDLPPCLVIPSQGDNDTTYTKDLKDKTETKERRNALKEMLLRDWKNNKDINPTGKDTLKELIRKYKDDVPTPDSGIGTYDSIIEDSDSSSETILFDHFLDATVSVPGYKLERRDRIIDGGGLLAYTRSDIPSWRRKDLESGHKKVPQVRTTNFGKNSFRYAAPYRNAVNFSQFKNQISF
ncbi:uncharacterized protein LOC123538761 [Mercenaria mercenaria]|uniref:uncharacterized protein LOC123538761 n=1 Tax=Mercenaria mercenaria TaxID=6596 RepID=UPI00234EAD3E|nr:uncharacterized protein LOC123538761 [Mercenaria mercenaria]